MISGISFTNNRVSKGESQQAISSERRRGGVSNKLNLTRPIKLHSSARRSIRPFSFPSGFRRLPVTALRAGVLFSTSSSPHDTRSLPFILTERVVHERDEGRKRNTYDVDTLCKTQTDVPRRWCTHRRYIFPYFPSVAQSALRGKPLARSDTIAGERQMDQTNARVKLRRIPLKRHRAGAQSAG